MTQELQTVIDRLELVEGRNRMTRRWSQMAVLIAIAAVAAPFAMPKRPAEQRVRYSAVEANRFLLRDLEGNISGGMEVDRTGTIKLVLGSTNGKSGAAFLEVQQNGVAHLTLRGPEGDVRAALLGSSAPSLSLSPGGERSSVALMTQPDGSGSLFLTDSQGRTRFSAP